MLKIPNAALRFYPKPEQVRESDRGLLEGSEALAQSDDDEQETIEAPRPAAERARAEKNRHQRHVWVDDGEFLRAVPVTTGMNDYQYTQLVSGSVEEGETLVTGIDISRR